MVTILMTIGSTSLQAQQVLTLNDFLAKVEKNNPEILAGQKQVASKEAMRKAAGAWEDPMLEGGFVNVPASNFSFDEEDMTGKEVGVTQNLPFFGSLRLKKKIARQEKSVAEFGLRQTRLDRQAEAKKAYYEWARAQREREFLRQTELIWQKLVSFTQTRYAQAQGEHHEYLRAQVEWKKVESELLANTDELKKSEAMLSFLAGENLLAEILRAEPLPEELAPTPATDSLARVALARNPEIGMLAAEEQKVRFEKSLAAKGYYPDFGLGFSYMQRNNPRDDMLSGRLMLRFPLFFWTARSKEVQGKSLEAEQVGWMRRNVENQKRAEVLAFWAEVDRLEKQIRLYRDELLPRARFLVEESQTAYTVGKLSFPDFTEGQLEEIELERMYIDFLADYWKVQAELEKTVGLD